MLLESLNKDQRKAAQIIEGPVMVFAGAGSGKTRTLTYRIANMIAHEINPKNILAITFTNKATNEMRSRLDSLVGDNASHLTISTFHSLCSRILRREIKVLDYSNRFQIIDDDDQLKIITEVLEAGNYDKKTYSSRAIRSKLNYCKIKDLKSEIDIENKIFNDYELAMKEANLLDFNDLLLKVRKIFTFFPNILKRYREKFRYILVDEFQDTDKIQYDIIKLLAQEYKNIFVVGDDDQSIYSFRGAHYDNMENFKKDFPEYELIKLEQNYRSTQTILKASNNLITNNIHRESKILYSDIEGSDEDIIINQARDQIDEVNIVIDNIKDLVKEGYEYSDIAIMYRSSVISRNFEIGLNQSNIPYRVYGGISYLKRKEIKDMIAYLRLIIFNDDIQSFKRIVNVPSRGIGAKTIEKIFEYQKEKNVSLFTALEDSKIYLKSKYSVLNAFKDLIISFKERLEILSLTDLYDELLEATEYIESLENDDSKEDRVENLMEFKSILYNIEHNGEIASRADKLIAAFDEAILNEDAANKGKPVNNGITVTTVHSAKGLEFGAVFIVAFEEDIFPNPKQVNEGNLEEERRIAYVAATRAKNKLFLTCAYNRLIYGRYRHNPQSRFLLEITKTNATNKKAKVEFKLENNSDYHIGQKVNHSTYGEGIIVSLNGDIGKICFTKQGFIKQFDMTHSAISKL